MVVIKVGFYFFFKIGVFFFTFFRVLVYDCKIFRVGRAGSRRDVEIVVRILTFFRLGYGLAVEL